MALIRTLLCAFMLLMIRVNSSSIESDGLCPEQCKCENLVDGLRVFNCSVVTSTKDINFGHSANEITYLDLSHNQITQLEFENLNLTKLGVLVLSYNLISHINNGTFEELKSLKQM